MLDQEIFYSLSLHFLWLSVEADIGAYLLVALLNRGRFSNFSQFVHFRVQGQHIGPFTEQPGKKTSSDVSLNQYERIFLFCGFQDVRNTHTIFHNVKINNRLTKVKLINS